MISAAKDGVSAARRPSATWMQEKPVKAIFGILSLVIVLAIVGSLTKKQLQAVGGGSGATRNAAAASAVGIAGNAIPGAVGADPNVTVPQHARSMQEKARSDTVRALEQGTQRNQRADP